MRNGNAVFLMITSSAPQQKVERRDPGSGVLPEQWTPISLTKHSNKKDQQFVLSCRGKIGPFTTTP